MGNRYDDGQQADQTTNNGKADEMETQAMTMEEQMADECMTCEQTDGQWCTSHTPRFAKGWVQCAYCGDALTDEGRDYPRTGKRVFCGDECQEDQQVEDAVDKAVEDYMLFGPPLEQPLYRRMAETERN